MTSRIRLVAALVAAALSAIACIATIVEPQWFEMLFDTSPDEGDGSLETLIAVAISAIALVVFSLIGRREWRRHVEERTTAQLSRND
ncbi:hypothetical protein AB4Z46_28120 [Variovorax sp. M-6]|uniref:hypothetical protein n=1 Tax=Variovorax sp. M-6 TaxID=3233041 RepID=UPI003F95E2AC